jgi:hypothetical protein
METAALERPFPYSAHRISASPSFKSPRAGDYRAPTTIACTESATTAKFMLCRRAESESSAMPLSDFTLGPGIWENA